jgi:RNA polymerase-interacting CarD/CdnL/TRCF family regulator
MKVQKISFRPGDRVSYLSFGTGTVVGLVTEHVGGLELELCELRLDGGSTIKVPVPTAQKTFVPIVSNTSVASIIEVLAKPAERRSGERWNITERRNFKLLTTGNPTALAQVVRDLHPEGKEVGYNIRLLYRAALSQLVTIVGVQLGHATRAETVQYLRATSGLSIHGPDADPVRYTAVGYHNLAPAAGKNPAARRYRSARV